MEQEGMDSDDGVGLVSPYSSPMHSFGSSIILLTNPESSLYKMELTLRSMSLDVEGVPKGVGDPLMNDLGINSVIGLVQSVVSQVAIMSNFSKDDIPMMLDYLADTLARDLMASRMVYEIKSPTVRDRVFFTVLTSAFVTLKRGFEEGDRRFWKGSQQEIISRVETMGGSNKGFLAKALGWGK